MRTKTRSKTPIYNVEDVETKSFPDIITEIKLEEQIDNIIKQSKIEADLFNKEKTSLIVSFSKVCKLLEIKLKPIADYRGVEIFYEEYAERLRVNKVQKFPIYFHKYSKNSIKDFVKDVTYLIYSFDK